MLERKECSQSTGLPNSAESVSWYLLAQILLKAESTNEQSWEKICVEIEVDCQSTCKNWMQEYR